MDARRILVMCALTAFLDLVGFSIMFPLFPQILDHYLGLEGVDSTIGHLESALRAMAGDRDDSRFLVVVLFGGVLGALYSILQFVFAPIWGFVSDRIGRRTTLLLTLSGTVLGYIGWTYAGAFWVLVFSRLLNGTMAGNLSTVSAIVADTTKPSDRAKGMGIVGAAIGLGFIVGPAVGGLSTLVDWTPRNGGAFALNPFSFAAILATFLAAANLLLVALFVPETLPPHKDGASANARTWNPVALFRTIGAPGIHRVTWLTFVYLTTFSAMEFSLTFLAVDRFDFGPRQNAMLFVFAGFVIAAVQGLVVRRTVPRLGERFVAFVGLLLLIPGFLALAFAQVPALLFVGLGMLAAGSALAMPCLSALVSQYAPHAQQGLALGRFRSLGALSRAVGPLAGGTLYWQLGSMHPYLLCALVMIIPIWMVARLPPPLDDDSTHAQRA